MMKDKEDGKLKGIKVVNVIASTKACEPLDIDVLSTSLKRVQYEPEIFSGLVYRREDPHATIVMFRTGKMVSSGTNSEAIARKSLKVTMKEIGVKSFAPIRIENVVAIADLAREIDLESLAYLQPLLGRVFYDPDQFPGLACRYDKVVIRIFRNGKLTVVGARKENQIKTIINRFVSFLKERSLL